jgi:hypothetical protein
MQITISLPKDLEQNLVHQAAQLNVSLETLILQSLRQFPPPPKGNSSAWPDAILSFTGIPDFPAFESYRNELLPPCEPELF